ncbi:branched-chain amino acid transport system / permease component family protein [Burkholderia pseudomallei MSHR511]|uniref:ATP-binding cassette domain-containing protein n=5 Tax=Burkholderia pseudomallei TaxID=28450 RepID=UPI0003E2E1A2|nr:branched-chain amino acid transport system / permease component family protein [Burkholderia pseudomallei MSHR511]
MKAALTTAAASAAAAPDAAGAPLALDVRRVVKRFGGVAALRGASLAVTRGTVHGLIGQNGAGKSTLVKLLAGLHAPDEGEITVGGVPFASGGSGSRASAGAARRHSTGIGFIHQERLLPATFTVAEALFFPHPPTLGGRASRLARLLPLDVKRMRRDCRAVLHTQFGLDLAPDRLIGELSVAEQQIVQITRALLGRHEILVFDEPSAALVSSEVDRLLRTIERLRANGHTILYVSHYLDEIARVCDRVSVLRDGADVAHFEARAVSRDTLVAAMIGAPQPAAAAPSAATARADARAAARADARADARVSARADAWGDDPHRAPAGADPARLGARAAPGAIALEARDLALPGRFGPLSLAVRRGEIVGLTGGLGSGGKDVIRALFGLARGVRGSIAVDGRPARVRRPHDAVAHGIALVPENRAAHGVALTLPVRENVVLADLSSVSRFGLVHGRREADVARALIRRLDIRPARPDLPARFLSGGNQQKVALAKWLGRASTVYLLDEPTVGVDVGAKAQIYRLIDALARAGAAVLLFSSDLTELLDVTDRVYVMARGEIVAQCASAETTTRDVLAWATLARDARPGGGAGAHDAAARTGTPGAAGAAARRSPETAGAPGALPGARGWTPARRVLLRGGPWLALALVFAGFSVSSPLFVTFANLGNVLQQSAVTGLLAFGLTIVMIGGGADAIKGGLDLSIAANLGLCAAVFAALTRNGHGDALALAATCATGVAVGALNAWAVAWLRIPPLLATLATMNVCAGLELVLTENAPISSPSPLAAALVGTGPFGAPWLAYALVGVAAALAALTHRTRYGLALHALGAHRAAALAAGVDARRYVASSYVASGLSAALAALASCALLSGSAPGAGDYLLPVVAAVLLGVVFSRRLVPTIPGTLVAVLFVGLLANGFQLNSVSSYWVSGVEGALILFVVAAVALLRRRRSQGAFDA